MGRKVASQLVENLKHAGIKHIYAVTGDSLNEVNDAVRKDGDVKWIHVRHEEAGAYAAMAEAELNGIGCCAGSSGPGHVHLINGLYDAQRSNASVLAIASTCPTYEIGTSYFQETSPMKLFEDCSGYNQLASTPQQFARMIQSAVQHAIAKKEVAVIGLPGDVAADKAVDSLTATYSLPVKSIFRPTDDELQKLANLINESKKVTLYCGIGVAGAHAELIQLADKIKSPIGYSFRGKMVVQHDNPYEVGMTGLLGLPSAYAAMHDADLLVLIGTDFPYQGFMPTKCKIAQIDNRPERIGRRAKVELGLAGDSKDTLAALLPLIETKSDDSFLEKQLKIYAKVKENLANAAEHKGTENNISPEFVASTVNKLADDDAIFTVDTGMCCVWGARYLQATGKRQMLGSFSHGSMANAMPMSIGASIARPNQQVIAFCGDGGISMLLGDLATIVQYNFQLN